MTSLRPWPDGPRRPLPKTVAPFQAETVFSYLARLAHANHLTASQLRRYVAESIVAHPRTDWLATASGYPEPVLRTRIRGLASGEQSSVSEARRGRPMCRLCMARRGVHEPVYCYLPAHITVCQRHQLWIGPPARTVDDQRYLRGRPRVLAAARTHESLARHHSQTVVQHTFRLARHFLTYWANAEQCSTAPILDKSIDAHLMAYPDVIAIAATLLTNDQIKHQTTRRGMSWPGELLRQINARTGQTHTDIAPIEQWWRPQSGANYPVPGLSFGR